jgi:hypothetical protein
MGIDQFAQLLEALPPDRKLDMYSRRRFALTFDLGVMVDIGIDREGGLRQGFQQFFKKVSFHGNAHQEQIALGAMQ